MKLIAKIIVFFILAQLLGIYAGLVVLLDITENPYANAMVVTSDSEDPTNAFFFMAAMLFGAVMMIIIMRKFKMPIIFRVIEFGLIAGASSVIFYSFLRLVLGFEEATFLGIVLGLVLAGIKHFRGDWKNIAVIPATAGVGVMFGVSVGLVPLVIFLILLSLYDYLAVFLTRHMVEIADYVIKKNLAFTVTASERTADKKEKRMDLGTGDLIAPVMFEVSALTYHPLATVFVFLGAVASMAVFLILVYKKKMVLPALPPIVFGMLVSFLIGMLLGFY